MALSEPCEERRPSYLSLESDRLAIFAGMLTIYVLWPKILLRPKTQGIRLDTGLLLKQPKDRWESQWSGLIRVLGFGLGLAWKHIHNPFYTKTL